MCGRYQLTLEAADVAAMHPRAAWRPGHATRHSPRNQVRPTTFAPVLVRSTTTSSGLGSSPVDIVLMRWGFPSPASRSESSSGSALINARRETIMELPTFRRLLARGSDARRCAVPATGFFEWHKPLGGRIGDPFLVRRWPDFAMRTMFMAGVFDVRTGEDGEEETSFVIITTPASKEYAWLHDRQPCFLDSQQEVDDWLDAARVPSKEAVSRLLRTQDGLSWKRMVSDLSQEAVNQAKPKTQLDITSFFASKRSQAVRSSRKGDKQYSGATGGSIPDRSPKSAKAQSRIGEKRGKITKSSRRVTKTGKHPSFKQP